MKGIQRKLAELKLVPPVSIPRELRTSAWSAKAWSKGEIKNTLRALRKDHELVLVDKWWESTKFQSWASKQSWPAAEFEEWAHAQGIDLKNAREFNGAYEKFWKKQVAYRYSPVFERARLEIDAIREGAAEFGFAPTYLGRKVIFAAGSALFMSYHIYQGLNQLARSTDPLEDMEIMKRMGADLITDAIYAFPVAGQVIGAWDIAVTVIGGLSIAHYLNFASGEMLISEWTSRNFVQKVFVDPIFQQMENTEHFRAIRFGKAIERLQEFVHMQPLSNRGGSQFEDELSELNLLAYQARTPGAQQQVVKAALPFKRTHYLSFLREYARKNLQILYYINGEAGELFSRKAANRYENELFLNWFGPKGYVTTFRAVLEDIQKTIGSTQPSPPAEVAVPQKAAAAKVR